MATIHPDTFRFLKELEHNNNREWFTGRRSQYIEIRESFIGFLEGIYARLIALDPELAGIDLRKSLFRINRDIRFSEDKSPYKTTIAAAIIAGGRRNFSEYAGYYLHLENGNSLAAGGAYMPPSPWITAIRAKIDNEPDRFRSIINDRNFTGKFGTIEGERLKGAPRGYSSDNKNIELLRYKSYLAVRNFSESEVLSDEFEMLFLETARALKPLNDFVNESLK